MYLPSMTDLELIRYAESLGLDGIAKELLSRFDHTEIVQDLESEIDDLKMDLEKVEEELSDAESDLAAVEEKLRIAEKLLDEANDRILKLEAAN